MKRSELIEHIAQELIGVAADERSHKTTYQGYFQRKAGDLLDMIEGMKRSEMLCAIDKRFPTLHMECNLEELLDFLESQGMQPPPYTFKQKVVNNPTGDITSVIEYECIPCSSGEDEQ